MPTSGHGKIVRDPLHGFVEVTEAEDRILSAPLVQRLTRVKQLAHSYLVFPSAVHTRLEHSLGTLYVAGRISEALELSETDMSAVRAAALLHDVGHGPFSHVFEDVLRNVNGPKFDHEQVTKIILEHDEVIRAALGNLSGKVTAILSKDEPLLSSLISGDLDADKMDYLRRDSYHTGVAYGVFDLERVLRCVCRYRDEWDGREYFAIEEKGMDALESYRLARYSMTRQVYEHHTRLAADDMFVRAILAAFEEKDVLRREDWSASDPKRLVQTYNRFDDNSIIEEIARSSNGLAGKLITDLRNRRIYKTAYELPLTVRYVRGYMLRGHLSNMTREEATEFELDIAAKVGASEGEVILHVQSSKIKLYERFDRSADDSEPQILVKLRDGSCEPMDQLSPIHADPQQTPLLYVFAPEERASAVRERATSLWGPSVRTPRAAS